VMDEGIASSIGNCAKDQLGLSPDPDEMFRMSLEQPRWPLEVVRAVLPPNTVHPALFYQYNVELIDPWMNRLLNWRYPPSLFRRLCSYPFVEQHYNLLKSWNFVPVYTYQALRLQEKLLKEGSPIDLHWDSDKMKEIRELFLLAIERRNLNAMYKLACLCSAYQMNEKDTMYLLHEVVSEPCFPENLKNNAKTLLERLKNGP